MLVQGENVGFELNGKIYHCALDITMEYIGGKWKGVVLWYLKNETLRFTELKNKIPDITEKMLSIQLKRLVNDGIINRKVYGLKPPVKVEYSLTEFGMTLISTLDAIAKWGRNLGETKGKLIDRN